MLRIHAFGALAVRDGDRQVQGAAAQPRRLAVLAVLARAGERGVTRDKLLALLWPDAADEPGRRALAQALYALRRDLGSEDAFLGTKDVRLNPDLIGSDVGDFDAALSCGELERAAGLYAGPFLDGFRVPGLDEFDRWIETERAALALRHAEALEALAERCERAGDPAAAVGWWRRLAATDSVSARVAVRLMRALDAAGDRAGALQHARIHEAMVDAQLGLPPSPEVTALVERLRAEPEPARPAAVPLRSPEPAPAATSTVSADEWSSAAPSSTVAASTAADGSTSIASTPNGSAAVGAGTVAAPAGSAVTPSVADPANAAVAAETSQAAAATSDVTDDAAIEAEIEAFLRTERRAAPARPKRRLPFRWSVVGGVVAGGAIAAGVILGIRGRAGETKPVVAVGRIATYSSGTPIAPLADLLSTDLSRVRGVRVVSRARLFETLDGVADTTGAALASAARAAGATQLVEGDVYPLGGGRLRLDLRRVDLSSGAVIAAYRVEGPDAVALADSGAARMAGDLPPGAGLGGVTTSSPVALRLYQNGLRAIADNDMNRAAGLFEAALAEDTAFAMAAWYAALSRPDSGYAQAAQRALRLAPRASDRERLVIRAGWANATSSPALYALADTLNTRYPREPAGPFYLGEALIALGRPLEAIPYLRRAAALDPDGLLGNTAGCPGCGPRRQIVSAYESADSFPAAAREARQWTSDDPRSTGAWLARMAADEVNDPGDEALADYRIASTLTPSLASDGILIMAQHLIRRGQYDRADQLLGEQIQSGDESRVVDGYWFRAIARREQGRLREALADARASRASFRRAPVTPGAAPSVALLEAQVRFEMGDYRASAALFDSIARLRSPGEPSQVARMRAWALAHRANALAALGDTVRVKALADTVREVGRRSFLGRDQRLYHHLLGLVLRARGDLPQAAAEFRAAMVSPDQGYTRTNLYLAAVLLRMNRPREAVPVLQAALRGALDGSNLYANRTDVHLLLGRAWQAAGQPDSAVAHFRTVAAARAHADPVILDTTG
jgi:DNA-binding SARP family transcriptional activator/TolB-like protein